MVAVRWTDLQFSVALLLASCGNSGKSGGGQAVVIPGESPIPMKISITDLSGSVFLDSTDSPARNFILNLIDHTALTVDEQILNQDGKFTIPLDKFAVDHVYSLELLTPDRVQIGDFDLLEAVPGAQTGFGYSPGGEGCDLGQIFVITDGFGEIDRAETKLAGYISGGFATLTGDYSAASLPLPPGVASVMLGSLLHATSTNQVLEAFYLKDKHLEKYAEAVGENAEIAVRIKGKGIDKMIAADVATGPEWLFSARMVAADGSPPEKWSKSGFDVPLLSSSSAEVRVLTGVQVAAGSALGIEIRIADRDPVTVYRTLDHVIVMPPKVDTVILNANLESEIDYGSSSDANGLSRPFIWKDGEIRLGVHLPLGRDGSPLRTDLLDKATVALSYFSSDANGNLSPEAVTRKDFPAPFNQATSIGVSDNIRRRWDPDNSQLNYVLTAPELRGLDRLNLSIDEGALLLANDRIDRVRVVITIKGDADESSTIVWIRK